MLSYHEMLVSILTHSLVFSCRVFFVSVKTLIMEAGKVVAMVEIILKSKHWIYQFFSRSVGVEEKN